MTKSGFDLDEIERLLAAATPGDWELYGHYEISAGNLVAMIECMISETEATDRANAALIVALHNSAPAMIAAIRELRAENVRLKDLRHTCCDCDKVFHASPTQGAFICNSCAGAD